MAQNLPQRKKYPFYIYTQEKADEYKKYSTQQKLEWLEEISNFLYYFTPKKNKEFGEKLKRGEI